MKFIHPYVFPGIKKEDLIESKFPHVGVLHPVVTCDDVIEIVATECGVTLEEIVSKKRSRKFAETRHILCKSLRDKCKMNVSRIGKMIGGRDHTTAIHSIRVYDDLYNTDENFRNVADRVNAKIGIKGYKTS